jgi:uncharacterized protein YjiS (DUF1127 family)
MRAERFLTTVIWQTPGVSLKKTLTLWYCRAGQRRQLRRLDDRLLRDIGIDRIAALRESEKPFWKA